MKRLRILHVLTTLDVGGAEVHVATQARGQCARGHEVRVVYTKGAGSLAEDFRRAGAESVRRIPAGPLFPLRLREDLAWCDVVHSHLLKADALAAVSALLLGARRKLVSGKHNDERALLHPLVSRVHGWLGRVPVRTIVLSDHVGAFIARHGRVPLERQRRVYYGLDPAPFRAALADGSREAARRELGLAEDDVAFVCIARFAPQKAHDVLLRATALARARDPRVRLLLAGDDPFGDGRERAEALARELGLDGDGAAGAAVRFLGIRRDVPRLLAASDALVMASRWEGLGLVFLEAMAARRPCIATDVSAIPEVVVDGETGLLVPPDDPERLAAAMLAASADAELRRRLGEAGAARVADRFGLDRMVDETLAVYAEVVAGGARRGRSAR